MELTQRQKIIFKTIVERFTATAEPVGSKTLMELLDFPVSSATIRNEMAILEKAGLLEKTHTSSGRIPSQAGYRYYVEKLMETNLSESVQNSLQQIFRQRHYSLDEIVNISCSILSEMTDLTSVVLGPDAAEQKLAHVQLIPVSGSSAVSIIITDTGHTENKLFEFETNVSVKDLKVCTDLFNDNLAGTPIDRVVDRMKELEPLMAVRLTRHEVLFEAFTEAFLAFAAEKVAVSGRSNMLLQPEFSDISRLRDLMRVLENSELFKAWTGQAGTVAIPAGPRCELIQIGDCSIVTAKFHYREKEEGQLMVVGPNRMQYAKVIALTDYMSRVIENIFGSQQEGGTSLDQEEGESGSAGRKDAGSDRTDGPGPAGTSPDGSAGKGN